MKTWFEDYHEGEYIRSPFMRIRAEDVQAYARFTHDLRPVLIASPTDLAAEAFVPPLYMLSVGMCLLQHAPERSYLPEKLIAFLGFETVKFPTAARPGDLIYSSGTVERLVPKGSRGQIVYWHETRNQDDELVVTSRHSMLIERREAG